MRLRQFRTEDGYTFFEQPDGTLTDTVDPLDAGRTYTNLGELQKVTAGGELKRITNHRGAAKPDDRVFKEGYTITIGGSNVKPRQVSQFLYVRSRRTKSGLMRRKVLSGNLLNCA